VIVWLEQGGGSARVGGKAAALGLLTRAGLPVPAGFCVTVEALSKLESQQVEDAIASALAELGTSAVAVRSSAVGEDGATASFAGAHLSRLNVRSPAAVVGALEEVRASATSPAALAYRARHALGGQPCMAALVQTMVDAEASGVLFTRDPLSGAEQFVVEGSFGLGEAVVSGAVTPDRFVLSSDGELVEEHISEKEIVTVPAEGGTTTVRLETARARRPCIDLATLRLLTQLGKRCEEILESPQDVEWALAGDNAWILQSRPITGTASSDGRGH
jgi:pyruvate,water dikinase